MDPQTAKSANITHALTTNTLEDALNELRSKIIQRGDLPSLTVLEQLDILEELASFALGRFLIQNRGLNGFWTDYILKHPEHGRISGLNSEGKPFGAWEAFLLDCGPTILATQERFIIFKNELQKQIRNGIVMASVPCGLMSDLLDLDFSGIQDFKLIGADIDPESTAWAAKRAYKLGLNNRVSFVLGSAWKLDLPCKVDVLTSNGLNIYEPDDDQVVALYQNFYNALNPGGILITSLLTPPPAEGGTATEWNFSCINREHAALQKIVFTEILGVKWQTFRSSEKSLSQLHSAGFKNVRLIYDEAHLFPTAIAEK